MRRAAAALAVLAAALTGCGGSAGDLMTISATGGGGPAFHVVVTGDGRGSCNGAAAKTLPSAHVLDARDVERRLAPYATKNAHFTTGPAGARRYVASTKDGTVTWVEGAHGAPAVVAKSIVLTQELKGDTCAPGI